MHPPPNQIFLFPDPEPTDGAAAAESSREDEDPLWHLAPLVSFKQASRDCPDREDWDPEQVKTWRWFVKNGFIVVDERMKADPARWHLEGLEPIYGTPENAKLVEALEELGLLKLGDD